MKKINRRIKPENIRKRNTSTRRRKSRQYGGATSGYGYTNPNSIDTGFDWMQVGEGAVAGAAAGSVVPGWGTLIGGVVGAGTGAIKAAMGQSAAKEQQQGIRDTNFVNKTQFDTKRLSGFSSTGNSGASLYARRGGKIPTMQNGGSTVKPQNIRDDIRLLDLINPGTYASTINKALYYPLDVAMNLDETIPQAYDYITNPGGRDKSAEILRENLYYNSPIYFKKEEIPRTFSHSANESMDAVSSILAGGMAGKSLGYVGNKAIKFLSKLNLKNVARAGKRGVNVATTAGRKGKIYSEQITRGKYDPFAESRYARQMEAAERPVFKVEPKVIKPKIYKGKKVIPKVKVARPRNLTVKGYKAVRNDPMDRFIYESDLPSSALKRGIDMFPTLKGTKEAFGGLYKKGKNVFKKKKTTPFAVAPIATSMSRNEFNTATEDIDEFDYLKGVTIGYDNGGAIADNTRIARPRVKPLMTKKQITGMNKIKHDELYPPISNEISPDFSKISIEDMTKAAVTAIAYSPAAMSRFVWDATPMGKRGEDITDRGSIFAGERMELWKNHPLEAALNYIPDNTIGIGKGLINEFKRGYDKQYDKFIAQPGSSLPAKPGEYAKGGHIPSITTDANTKKVGAGVQVDTSKDGTDKIKANIDGTPVYLDDEEIIVNDQAGQPVVLSDDLGTADQYRAELANGGNPEEIAMKYAEIAKRLNPNPDGNKRVEGGNVYGDSLYYDMSVGKQRRYERRLNRNRNKFGRRINKINDKFSGRTGEQFTPMSGIYDKYQVGAPDYWNYREANEDYIEAAIKFDKSFDKYSPDASRFETRSSIGIADVDRNIITRDNAETNTETTDRAFNKYKKRYDAYSSSYSEPFSRYSVDTIDDKRQQRQFNRLGRTYDKMGGLSLEEAQYFNDRYDTSPGFTSDPMAYGSGDMSRFREAMNAPRQEQIVTAEEKATARAGLNDKITNVEARLDAGERGSKFITDETDIVSNPNFRNLDINIGTRAHPAQLGMDKQRYDIARNSEYGSPQEDYIPDIPFDTKTTAARSQTFNFADEGSIDDIPFNTKAIAANSQKPTPWLKRGNNAALLGQGITALGTLGANAMAMARLNKTEFPEFNPYPRTPLDIDINKPLYDKARSDIRSSTDTGVKNIMSNTASSNVALARANALRGREISSLGDLAAKEGTERGQISNTDRMLANRHLADINRLRAGHDMAGYRDKVSRIQTGVDLAQNVTTSIDNLITNYQQGKVDENSIQMLAATYNLDYKPGDSFMSLINQLNAKGIKDVKTMF